MLGIHLISIFTNKTPWTLVAFVPVGLLIVKTLTNVLCILRINLLFSRYTYYHNSNVQQSV